MAQVTQIKIRLIHGNSYLQCSACTAIAENFTACSSSKVPAEEPLLALPSVQAGSVHEHPENLMPKQCCEEAHFKGGMGTLAGPGT